MVNGRRHNLVIQEEVQITKEELEYVQKILGLKNIDNYAAWRKEWDIKIFYGTSGKEENSIDLEDKSNGE